MPNDLCMTYISYIHVPCFVFCLIIYQTCGFPKKNVMHFKFLTHPWHFFNLRTIQWHLFAVSRLAASTEAAIPVLCMSRAVLVTLPETNSSHLKMNPWKFGDSYWKPSFFGAMLVSGSVPKFLSLWCLTMSHSKVRGVACILGRFPPY